MAKRLLSSGPVVAFGSALAAAYIRLVYNTSEVLRDPPDTDAKLFSEHPQIFAMWHGQFGMLPKIKPDRPADVAAMVARHGDAELIGAVLQRFGMWLIRGAGAGRRRRDRGGAVAFRGALAALQNGTTVAMTADFAPGPARRAGDGIVMLAKLSGRPIVPCAMATSRFIALKSWSAFTINLPFSKLGIVVGDPVRVPEDADSATLEAARIAVERGLNQATARAYDLAGAIDPLSPQAQLKNTKPAFAIRAYRALTRYTAPLAAPLMLAWRTRIGKEEPGRRPERYGEASVARPAGFLAWFHAASVGETNAVLPVIEAIASDHPEINVLLTTGTVTSAKLARARLPKGAVHQYVPLDNQDYVRRFLAHWRPDLAVFVEFGDLAEPRARDECAPHSARAGQRPYVVPLLPPLARPAWLERPVILSLQPGARPEPEHGPALHRSRHAARRAGRQSQGRRAAASGRPCRTQEACHGTCRAHGVARGKHPSR